ncbi:MAG: glutamate 5-kinase [Patescibacteria group bacterium]
MRFVVKVGTSLVTNEDYQLNVGFLESLAASAANLQKRGHQIIIVSSGAVAAGRSQLVFPHDDRNIPYRQALAAIGQGILMKNYYRLFRDHGVKVAQALLTSYDFANRQNFLNTKSVFELLLQNRVVPIVNENDVTTIAELKFGDNDMLSAKTAIMVEANYLVLFTDVDGLYSADPKDNPDAKLISIVRSIDDSVRGLGKGAHSKNSMGGMITKIAAAEHATSAGVKTIIVCGRKEGILGNIIDFCEKNVEKKEIKAFPYGTLFLG